MLCSRICSAHGLKMSTRAKYLCDVENMIIRGISNEFYFTKDDNNEENNNKLFLFMLYLWFTTSTYLLTGKCNQIELPAYLVEKIKDYLTSCLKHNENFNTLLNFVWHVWK